MQKRFSELKLLFVYLFPFIYFLYAMIIYFLFNLQYVHNLFQLIQGTSIFLFKLIYLSHLAETQNKIYHQGNNENERYHKVND